MKTETATNKLADNNTTKCVGSGLTMYFYNLEEQQVEWEIQNGKVFVQYRKRSDEVMFLEKGYKLLL